MNLVRAILGARTGGADRLRRQAKIPRRGLARRPDAENLRKTPLNLSARRIYLSGRRADRPTPPGRFQGKVRPGPRPALSRL
jgi:hypothetical protein